MEKIEAYRDAIKERLGQVCIDRKADGTCSLPEDNFCAIDRHLPEIIQAVKAVKSDRIEEYSRSIAATVCSLCKEGETGHCDFREVWKCCLENYVYIVVEAIEEVDSRLRTP